MEKRLLKVVIFSLCLAGLTTRWLNLKANEAAQAPSQISKNGKARSTLKTKASQSEALQRPATKSPKTPLTTSNETLQPQTIESALQALSNSLYLPNQNFEAQERELRALMADSTTAELKLLAKKVLTESENPDLRSSAAYMLNLAGPSAIPLLTEIAATSFRETAKGNFEAGLRVGALQRIDQWAKDGQSVEQELRTVLRLQKDPALKLFARTSLEGILEKKPGKLLRLSQKSLEEL